MEVVSLKLMYLCHVLRRFSKHFLIITFDVAGLTKKSKLSCALKFHTSIIGFCMVYPYQGLTKGRESSFKPTKPNLMPHS